MKSRHHKKEVLKGFHIRDFILGGQDGLVNVLGLVLGVATATMDSRMVIISGLVGTFAESISMAAVAYTSSKAAKEYYDGKLAEEVKDIKSVPAHEKKDIREVYAKKGYKGRDLDKITELITKNKRAWLETIMSEKLRLSPSDYERPLLDAWLVGIAAVVGSFVPLTSFFFLPVKAATVTALAVSGIVLFAAGAAKAKFTIGSWRRSGVEMLIIGLTAAIVGYVIGLLFGVK